MCVRAKLLVIACLDAASSFLAIKRLHCFLFFLTAFSTGCRFMLVVRPNSSPIHPYLRKDEKYSLSFSLAEKCLESDGTKAQ